MVAQYADIILISYVMCGEDGEPDTETAGIWTVDRGTTAKKLPERIDVIFDYLFGDFFDDDETVPTVRVWEKRINDEEDDKEMEFDLFELVDPNAFVEAYDSVDSVLYM